MTAPQTVNIQRQSINQPWGMKICGGRDFRMQLQIKKAVHIMDKSGVLLRLRLGSDEVFAIHVMESISLFGTSFDMREKPDFSLYDDRQAREHLVDADSPAAGVLHNGDAILGIGGTSADKLTHMQAHQLIKSAGNHLQLTVLPGHFKEITGIKPKGPVKFSPWRNKQQ